MKMTKATYKKARGLLEDELRAVQATLRLAQMTDGASLPDIDMWDEYHDREDEIKNSISDLDGEWGRRNWTTSDYNTASLIAQNID